MPLSIKTSLGSWLRRFFFFAGLTLFGFLVYRIGPEIIWKYLVVMGPKLLWILVLHLLLYLCYAWSWEIFLKTLNTRVRYWEIFKIKVAGEAVNNISPLGWGGGDPARVYFLKNHIPVTEGTASVVVDRTLHNFAAALFLLFGIILSFLKIPLTPLFKVALLLLLGAILVASAVLYFRSHEGLCAFLVDLLKFTRLKKNFSEKTLRAFQEIDEHISRFYQKNKTGFWSAFLLSFLGRLLAVAEIFLIARFLHHPLDWAQSYLLASMTGLINMVFIFVPGALGVLEGAYAGIFALFGLDPAVGTSIQIVRRVRMVVWTAIGFVMMAWFRTNASGRGKSTSSG